MNELNFSQDEQDRIWTLLVTILDLGNLTFDDTNRQNNENLPCVISDLCKIDQLSSVLGYPSADFQKMLVYSKIEIPRQ
jgi:myosin heavy subunit